MENKNAGELLLFGILGPFGMVNNIITCVLNCFIGTFIIYGQIFFHLLSGGSFSDIDYDWLF